MMCLHTILSQSFIGAIVLLVVVHAMPTDSKVKAAAPVPLGVINPPKKDLWWPLLDQTHAPWLKKIDLDPKNPEKRWECGESYDKNSEVFATDFTRKMLKAKSMVPGNPGKNNLGIFTLPHEVSEFESILGDETVLKLVDYNWEGSSCEVFALRKFAEFQKAKGQTPTFVTSGFVKFKDPPRKSGLVVMRKVPGMPLKGTKQWQEEGGQRQEMVDKVFKNIADFDYELIQILVHRLCTLWNVYPLAVNSNIWQFGSEIAMAGGGGSQLVKDLGYGSSDARYIALVFVFVVSDPRSPEFWRELQGSSR
ncbi:hypothetical protein EV368DRAFT_65689 [Lentinula lateritia]|nr:hypothetical protein EV368DRAFT_65689 [Lentinula lateritia]